MWLLYAFIAPAAYGVAEVLDNFLANRIFKHPLTLAFFSAVFNLVVVAVLFIVSPPILPPLATLPIFLSLGFINFAYLYPYYRGLQSDDTSVVAALFGLGRIFIPILAFFIVDEVLTIPQYIGVMFILFASIAVSLKKEHAKLLFSKSFWYIGLAAFLLSFEGVLLKYLFNQGVQYSAAVGGEILMATLFTLPLLGFKKVREDISLRWRLFLREVPVFTVEEGLTFVAFASEAYAIDMAKVTLVKAIGMFIPFFVLFYGKMLKTKFPLIFKEHTENEVIIKKVLTFSLMIVGLILLGTHE